MFKFLKERKKDNKGFTFVELVIVVAILAILVGILAPQYTKYVEKSRKASDVANMDEMIKAVQVYAVDHALAAKGNSATKVEITMSNTGAATITKDYEDALKEYVPNYTNIKLKSNKWGKSTVKVTKYDPTEFGTYSENGSVPAAEDKKASE